MLPDLGDIEEKVHQFVESLPCRFPEPYPEVMVAEPNAVYAQMLLDAFANGGAAELTAITQYFHHSLVMENQEVANLLLCIALVEMLHLDLIGELIEQLGGDPRFWRANTAYWSGGNVAYGIEQNVGELLRLDIESEETAIDAYERLLHEIDDPGVQRVLMRIIRDEQVHLHLFQQALQKYCTLSNLE